MALTLYGVTVDDAPALDRRFPDTELVLVRDLAAICAPAEYRSVEPGDDAILRVNEVLAAYAERGPVLPAPVGVVFRAREAVLRWLELHYVALSDALGFVENRVAARVHLWRPGTRADADAGSDLAAAAAEILRTIRRSAVSSVPLRIEQVTGIVLSAAYLVEQELWDDFRHQVEEAGTHTSGLRVELTGPWPPYDFVQMRLGN